jgi:hypothetical protein
VRLGRASATIQSTGPASGALASGGEEKRERHGNSNADVLPLSSQLALSKVPSCLP